MTAQRAPETLAWGDAGLHLGIRQRTKRQAKQVAASVATVTRYGYVQPGTVDLANNWCSIFMDGPGRGATPGVALGEFPPSAGHKVRVKHDLATGEMYIDAIVDRSFTPAVGGVAPPSDDLATIAMLDEHADEGTHLHVEWHATDNTLDTYAGWWSRIASGTLLARWSQVVGLIDLVGGGNDTDAKVALGRLRVNLHQIADSGLQPTVGISLAGAKDVVSSDIVCVITGTDPTVYEIYLRVSRPREIIRYGGHLWTKQTQHDWDDCLPFVTTLPAGTQYVAQNGDTALVGSSPYLYAEDYGVVASSTVNNAVAFQAAIDAAVAQKKTLVTRGVTYGLGAQLDIPSYLRWLGNDAHLLRLPGTIAGTANMLKAAVGATRIDVRDLWIDGNKAANSLVAETASDRFSGFILDGVTNSLLDRITITGTVNNEAGGAGIYVVNCTDVEVRDAHGYDNDRTAILFWNSTRCHVPGALTHDNLGSGVSSYNSPECTYDDQVSYDNGSAGSGYSNVSVNGHRSRGDNIITWGAGGSGLNIGHDLVDGVNDSDGSQFSNVISFGNVLEGVGIVGSARVQMVNVEVYANQRNNFRITSNSTGCKVTNLVSRDSAGGQGIYIESGSGHIISNFESMRNFGAGAYVTSGATAVRFRTGLVSNNGQGALSGGISLVTTTKCILDDVEIWDDQATKTQDYGLQIAGGSGHRLYRVNSHDNLLENLRRSSSPADLRFFNCVPVNDNETAVGAKRHLSSSAAPVAGTFVVGDIFWDSIPPIEGTAGSQYIVVGRICTTAGTPGTWTEMRTLTGT